MKRLFALTVMISLTLGSFASSAAARAITGAVYVMTNSPVGNAVIVFNRSSDGALSRDGTYPSGGTGTGTGLGNQGAVTLSSDQGWLFVVNPGSDDLSVFSVDPRGLLPIDLISSGGDMPVSVTSHGRLVYVLNAGSDGVAGFLQEVDGTLAPIAGSVRSLSGTGTAPAQIQFSPDGRLLIVSEKATSNITVFAVDDEGRPGNAEVNPSAGQTPFGFAFGKRGQLFVSEAFGGASGASALSSYAVAPAAQEKLSVITPSAPTHETAACWVVVDNGGRHAYTTNTGDDTVSGFSIEAGGQISLLKADGKTGLTGPGPIDAAFSADDRFLYVLNSGNGSLSAFRVRHDGRLESIAGAAGLPAGANGLAAR